MHVFTAVESGCNSLPIIVYTVLFQALLAAAEPDDPQDAVVAKQVGHDTTTGLIGVSPDLASLASQEVTN